MAFMKKEGVVFSITCSLVFYIGAGFAEQDVTSEPADGHANQASGASTQLQSQGGYRAYIDPETGELTSPPEIQETTSERLHLSPEEMNAMSTSSDDLVEEPLPGGGYMIDLQGRFQSSVFATVDKSGKTIISHTPPKEAAKEAPPGSYKNPSKAGE